MRRALILLGLLVGGCAGGGDRPGLPDSERPPASSRPASLPAAGAGSAGAGEPELPGAASAAPSPAPTPEPSAAPPEAPTASAAPTSSASAPPKPPGPPPAPPMAIVWRKHLPPFGRHPSQSARLEVNPDGSAEYESEEGSGSEAGPVGFGLPPLACSGRLDPALHEKLVRAGQAVQKQGCDKGPQKRGMGRWTIETSYAGKKRRCAIRREGQVHADFEALREEAVDAVCAAPPARRPERHSSSASSG